MLQLVLVSLLVAAGTASSNERQAAGGGIVDVYPTVPDNPAHNFTLNDALAQQGQAISNTILNLQPGVHNLTTFHLIADSSNVTFLGNGEVKITCSQDVGLAFINISTLIFKNLTIEKCGLSKSNLYNTVKLIDSNLFTIPNFTQIALFISSSTDIELTSVTISDTGGIGLLAMNPRGTTSITSSQFVSNLAAGCFARLTTGGIGGGAIFAYSESEQSSAAQLLVQSTTFDNNSNCNPESTLQWYAQYTSFLGDSNATYTIGGGGGLTVYTSQYSSVSVEVQDCLFQNNTAQFGAGISINMFERTNNLTFRISDSRFTSNGAENIQYAPGFTSSGPGIAVLNGIQYASNKPRQETLSRLENVLTIERCDFEDGIAYSGGAVILQSQYRTPSIPTTILIDGCLFTNNSAYLGGVSVISEFKATAAQQGMQVIHRDCKFTNNQVITAIPGFLSTTAQSSSIVEIAATNMTFQGENVFENNYGTPIHGTAVIFNVEGELKFMRNTGSFGGGLSLETTSFLILTNNSYLEFTDNQAYVGGGAIFINVFSATTLRGLVYYDCFLFFEKLDVACVQYSTCSNNLQDLNVTINITNNDAPLGEAIFGSTLRTCEWITYYENQTAFQNHTDNGFDLLAAIGILHIDPPLNGSMNIINTQSVRINPNSSDTNSTIISIMPGEVAMLNLTAEDVLNQSVPDPITSYVLDNAVDGVFTSLLGSSGYWFLDRQARNNVPITVLSQTEPTAPTNVTVGMFSVNSVAQIVVTVIAEKCYPGFVFDNTTVRNHYPCKCNDVFDEIDYVHCDSDTATITVPNGKWVGTVTEDNRTIAVGNCFPRYCRQGTRTIPKGNFNSQCVDNRVGILCGRCQNDYSITFGDAANCIRCSSAYLVSLIFFALGGMSLMYKLGRLDITIKHGLFNSILFYSNIFSVYRPFLIPQSLYTEYSGIVIIISWLNLTLGFPLCFYDGMDALATTYLSFVFPAYVWFLMGITALGARYNRWPKFMARFRKNAVPLFATLTLMTYVTTLINCVQVFASVRVDGVGIQWGVDPTVPYLDPWRIPLMLIALATIVFYLIPLPFLILFPSITTKLWIGRKLLPIYDVFWAPFRQGMHFWVGMRLILRLIPLTIAYASDAPLNLLLLSVFLGLYLLAHLTFQPFKLASRNYLDSYLTINLLLITVGVLYFNVDNNADNQIPQLIYILVFTLTAYLAFIAVYGYHFYITYLKDNKKFQKLEAACIAKLQKIKDKYHKFHPQLDKEYDSVEDSQVVVVASSRRLRENGYREPLLGDSELSASTYNTPRSINNDDVTAAKVETGPRVVTGYDLVSPMDDNGELSIELTSH